MLGKTNRPTSPSRADRSAAAGTMTPMSVTVLIEVLLAALVLFGAGAAATGRLITLADVPADDAGDGLPEGPLRAPDLDRVHFPLAFRGYRMADVDMVIDRLAGELTIRDAEITRLGGTAPPSVPPADAPDLAMPSHPGDDEIAGATRVGEPGRLDEI